MSFLLPSYTVKDRGTKLIEIDNQPIPPAPNELRPQIPHIYQVPNPHDVLISDIQHETLETTIATELGITYLSTVPGFLYVWPRVALDHHAHQKRYTSTFIISL